MDSCEQVLADFNDFASKKQEHRLQDGLWVVWAVHREAEEVEIHIVTNWSDMVVHWGVFFANSSDWALPPQPYPELSQPSDERSLDSRFIEDDMLHGKGIYSVQIKLFNLSGYSSKLAGIKFVLKHHDKWFHHADKKNFVIKF